MEQPKQTETDKVEIISARWDPTFTAFSVATERGFMICTALPLSYLSRMAKGKGFAIVEMHPDFNKNDGSKILALVGGGRVAHFPTTKVVIWDCTKDDRSEQEKKEFPNAEISGAPVGEIGLRTEVKNVKLHKKALFIALIDKILVYDLASLDLIDTIHTRPNPTGMFAITQSSDISYTVACPATFDKPGFLFVKRYGVSNWEKFIPSYHTQEIALIAANDYDDVVRVATVSKSGRIIHVHAISKIGPVICVSEDIKKLARGSDEQVITSFDFNQTGNELCIASRSGTLHLYSTYSPKITGADPGYTNIPKTTEGAEGSRKIFSCEDRNVTYGLPWGVRGPKGQILGLGLDTLTLHSFIYSKTDNVDEVQHSTEAWNQFTTIFTN